MKNEQQKTKFKDKMILVFNLYVGNIDDEDVEGLLNNVRNKIMEDTDDTVQIYVVPRKEKVDKVIEVYNTTTDKHKEFIENINNVIQDLIDIELEKKPELSKVLGISDSVDDEDDCYECPYSKISELEQTNEELVEDNEKLYKQIERHNLDFQFFTVKWLNCIEENAGLIERIKELEETNERLVKDNERLNIGIESYQSHGQYYTGRILTHIEENAGLIERIKELEEENKFLENLLRR